jgi:hypothetical protein
MVSEVGRPLGQQDSEPSGPFDESEQNGRFLARSGQQRLELDRWRSDDIGEQRAFRIELGRHGREAPLDTLPP